MTGYELLFLVLFAMYLSECIAWVPEAGFAFRAFADRPWRPASDLLGVLRGRWRAFGAGWIPGTGGVAVAEAGPPGLSPLGLCACDSNPRGALSYEELGPLEVDGVDVRAGSRVVARAGSAVHALHLRVLILRLQACDPAEREILIRAEHDRLLDPREARRRVARHRVCARPLGTIARALAVTLFVVLPVGLVAGGLWIAAPILAAAVAMAWLAAWAYRRVLRRAGGTGPIVERMLTMILMPPAAIRAGDFLARDLFGGLHWLPLAHAACVPSSAGALAAGALRRLRHPTDPERVACCAAGAWAAAEWGSRLERWIETEQGPGDRLLAAPAPESRPCAAYCPRCLQQYVAGRAWCSDCPGVRLEPLART